jgi:hypothetical protein
LDVLLCCLAATLVSSGPLSAADAVVPGISELSRLDRLPQFRDSTYVGSVSSYDRTGGNDDGFSGKYSFVAKEEGGLVVADLPGPGVIYRIWTPTPSDDWFEFYFDGETTPRLRVKFRDMFTRSEPPFVAPLTGFGAGGYYSYVPLPYEKSCKIVARAERVQFYQINYAQYPADKRIRSWTPETDAAGADALQQACVLFASAGKDLSVSAAPLGAKCAVHANSVTLAPGSTQTVFTSQTGGRIVGLRIGPSAAVASKARDVLLRITWDGAAQPAVNCPIGDFFGCAWGQPAAKSILAGIADGVGYSYFPMPYEKSAKIELVSEREAGPPVELRAEVVTAEAPKQVTEGYFTTVWCRENPTTKGKPFTFAEVTGRGHLVGCFLQAQGLTSGETLFFEGDDETTIDGELTVRGTGSEDFFNGGWYDVPDRWERTMSFPLSGCLAYEKPLGRSGGYRLMLGDVYAFRKSILQTIEHAPTGNEMVTDYVGVTYLYLDRAVGAAGSLPAAAQRAVTDPTTIIFKPAWAVPIRSFTFRNATITKMDEDVAGARTSFLRMQTAETTDWFGDPFIAFECRLPAAGRYLVTAELVKGPAQGIVQMYRNELPAGEPIDMYAAERGPSGVVTLGTIDADEGANVLMLKLIGKHDQATGRGIDISTIQWERAAAEARREEMRERSEESKDAR